MCLVKTEGPGKPPQLACDVVTHYLQCKQVLTVLSTCEVCSVLFGWMDDGNRSNGTRAHVFLLSNALPQGKACGRENSEEDIWEISGASKTSSAESIFYLIHFQTLCTSFPCNILIKSTIIVHNGGPVAMYNMLTAGLYLLYKQRSRLFWLCT